MHPSRRQVLSSLTALLVLPALPARARRRGAGPATGDDARAFLEAVRAGRLDVVRRMLAADEGLASARDERGRSAFVLAQLEGRGEVAELLRATGLELDVVEAVMAEDWPRFEALAARDSDSLHAAHPVGGTPLYAAALVGSQGMWRLRKVGCDPDAAPAGGSGFTPARGALEATHTAWAGIALADLCGNGADVNARQRGGSSVLHAAVARRDATLVRLAVRKGADVGALDEHGRSPEALARERGWEEGQTLLAGHAQLPRDHRASRFALDANREPVAWQDLAGVPRELQGRVTGSSHRDLDAVRQLLHGDPRLVFSVSNDDELAIEACAHTGARDIIRLHLDHGAPLSLPTAVSLGDRDAVSFWLERDPLLVHERGAHDFPLMWYAVLGGAGVEMAELLAERGVPVDQQSMGTTALHWCARRGERDLARWLVEHGADAEALGHKWSRSGQTPLEIARGAGDAQVVRLLEEAGAVR